ncbi:unnamed protein product [Prunus armeniaca]|uniref:Uncharacterized protein n=1 Tax=Prunus armeniaca TaxID=36596 RepID=A0A6J5W3D5_PRUAR|nr:unnamed protein product [Prunus armeniaca]
MKKAFIFDGFDVNGELGYEIQIREAVVRPNCLTILRFKEQLFGISCYQLVVEKGFTNQEEFPDAILQVRGQYRLFQLHFGAIKNDLNKSDLLIQAVFDDIEPLLKSSSSPFDQALVQYEKKDTSGQIFPSTPPPLSKETSTPLTASFTSSPNESMPASKKKARIAVRKKLFTSLIQTQKKFKMISAPLPNAMYLSLILKRPLQAIYWLRPIDYTLARVNELRLD